jgi:hypothetical protein
MVRAMIRDGYYRQADEILLSTWDVHTRGLYELEGRRLSAGELRIEELRKAEAVPAKTIPSE